MPSSTRSSSTFVTVTSIPSSAASISTVISSRFWFMLAIIPSFIRAIITFAVDISSCSQKPATVIGTVMAVEPSGITIVSSTGSSFFGLLCFFLSFFSNDLSVRSLPKPPFFCLPFSSLENLSCCSLFLRFLSSFFF